MDHSVQGSRKRERQSVAYARAKPPSVFVFDSSFLDVAPEHLAQLGVVPIDVPLAGLWVPRLWSWLVSGDDHGGESQLRARKKQRRFVEVGTRREAAVSDVAWCWLARHASVVRVHWFRII
jgi:hypothetical protein